MGPGTLYGVPARLVADGLIEALPAQERRRPYRITGLGRRTPAEQAEQMQRVAELGLRRLRAARGHTVKTPNAAEGRPDWRVRMVVGLYPPVWRHCYATEFAALLEDSGLGVRQVADVAAAAGPRRADTVPPGRHAHRPAKV